MFEELIEKDKSFILHHHNIHTPRIDLYEVHINLSQINFSDLFVCKKYCQL